MLLIIALMAFALLWRVGSWSIPPSQSLVEDEGLRVGAQAPQLAATAQDDEYHLEFLGQWTFFALGSAGCSPCAGLLDLAPRHAATRWMRLVYVSDVAPVDIDSPSSELWETYKFHNEDLARQAWRAPVSPYFHVIDPSGRIAAKGLASHSDHLDRLMSLSPIPAVLRGPK